MKHIKLLTGILFIGMMSLLFANATGWNVYAIFMGLLFIAILFPKRSGVLSMAVEVEIWQNDIIDNLFKNNDFAARAFNGDQYVIGGAVVHIPMAGAPTPSQRNATEFPIAAVKRADADITYALDNYFQVPKYVQNVEQAQLSYDKRQSIMGEQQAQLIQDAMDGLLYRWGWQGTTIGVTAGNSVLTLGGAAAPTIDGATGQRLVFTEAIFGIVKLKMDRANILNSGRVALLTADHYQQFLDSLSDAARTNFNRSANMQTGVIGTYLGFDVMMRSTVQRWRQVGGIWVPVDTQDPGFGASDQTGDSAASLFYQEQTVERARGDVKVFEDAGRPEYFGDVFSMNMRLGGRQRRVEGVWAVVEAIAGA